MIAPESFAAIPILIASLIGSVHCIGMCGGFVAIYSRDAKGVTLPHMLYSLGRLCTYMLLGGAAAFLGAKVNSLVGVANIAAFFVGAFLIGLGLYELFLGKANFLETFHGRVGRFVSRPVSWVFKGQSPGKPFFIGLLTTLLPCGWLYAFVALSLGSADLLTGFMIMLMFWVGTLPAMVTVGLVGQRLTQALGSFAPRMTAILLIVSGAISFTLHLSHSNHNHGSHSHTMHHHEASHQDPR